MNEGPLAGKLNGIVECDETYVGGKPRHGGRQGHIDHRRTGKLGHWPNKTPVMVLVERGGEAISKPIEHVDANTLQSAIKEAVDNKSTIMTDDLKSYRGVGRGFAGGHHFVKHSMGEYVRGNVTTNTAESYFSLLKRGIEGVFHHVSKQHLDRYCDEFEFRWNHRKVNDGTRAEHAIIGAEGKRLTYKKAVL